ncbi:MAG: hypothetical protein QXR48_03145 [Candidatus Woesearchaeota archaeon]
MKLDVIMGIRKKTTTPVQEAQALLQYIKEKTGDKWSTYVSADSKKIFAGLPKIFTKWKQVEEGQDIFTSQYMHEKNQIHLEYAQSGMFRNTLSLHMEFETTEDKLETEIIDLLFAIAKTFAGVELSFTCFGRENTTRVAWIGRYEPDQNIMKMFDQLVAARKEMINGIPFVVFNQTDTLFDNEAITNREEIKKVCTLRELGTGKEFKTGVLITNYTLRDGTKKTMLDVGHPHFTLFFNIGATGNDLEEAKQNASEILHKRGFELVSINDFDKQT